MPVITYTSQGADKVVGDLSKQVKAIEGLIGKIVSCNGDAAKMTEVFKAFTMEQGKSSEATQKVSRSLDEESKAFKRAVSDLARHRTAIERESQAIDRYQAIISRSMATMKQAEEAKRNGDISISRSIQVRMEQTRIIELANRAIESHSQKLRSEQRSIDANTAAAKKASTEAKLMLEAQRNVNSIIERGITPLQRNAQELAKLNNEHRSGAISTRQYAEARRILMAEQVKLVQNFQNEQRALAMKTDSARRARMEADLMAAAQRNVNSIIERGISPLQRNALAVARLNQDHKNGAISSRQHAEGLRVLNVERARLQTATTTGLTGMNTVLPGILSNATAIAGAFGLGISATWGISAAINELKQLNEMLDQQRSRTITLATAESKFLDYYESSDPKTIKAMRAKLKGVSDTVGIKESLVMSEFDRVYSSKGWLGEDIALDYWRASLMLTPENVSEAAVVAQSGLQLGQWFTRENRSAESILGLMQYGKAKDNTSNRQQSAELYSKIAAWESQYGGSAADAIVLGAMLTNAYGDKTGHITATQAAHFGKRYDDFFTKNLSTTITSASVDKQLTTLHTELETLHADYDAGSVDNDVFSAEKDSLEKSIAFYEELRDEKKRVAYNLKRSKFSNVKGTLNRWRTVLNDDELLREFMAFDERGRQRGYAKIGVADKSVKYGTFGFEVDGKRMSVLDYERDLSIGANADTSKIYSVGLGLKMGSQVNRVMRQELFDEKRAEESAAMPEALKEQAAAKARASSIESMKEAQMPALERWDKEAAGFYGWNKDPQKRFEEILDAAAIASRNPNRTEEQRDEDVKRILQSWINYEKSIGVKVDKIKDVLTESEARASRYSLGYLLDPTKTAKALAKQSRNQMIDRLNEIQSNPSNHILYQSFGQGDYEWSPLSSARKTVRGAHNSYDSTEKAKIKERDSKKKYGPFGVRMPTEEEANEAIKRVTMSPGERERESIIAENEAKNKAINRLLGGQQSVVGAYGFPDEIGKRKFGFPSLPGQDIIHDTRTEREKAHDDWMAHLDEKEKRQEEEAKFAEWSQAQDEFADNVVLGGTHVAGTPAVNKSRSKRNDINLNQLEETERLFQPTEDTAVAESEEPAIKEIAESSEKFSNAVDKFERAMTGLEKMLSRLQKNETELARVQSFNNPALMEYPEQDMRTIYG